MQTVSGFFNAGDDVSVFTLQGKFLAIGKIYSTYGDESYLDVFNAPGHSIGTGDAVFRNYANAEAIEATLNKGNVFGIVAAASRADNEFRYSPYYYGSYYRPYIYP